MAQKVDIGAGVSRTKINDGEDYGSVGPMITLHLTDNDAVQVLTDINVRRWEYQGPRYADVRGVYFVQYRRTFGSPAQRVGFSLAAGVAGGVERHYTSGFTYTEDGHYEQGKWVPTAPVQKDYPAQTRWHIAPPIVPAFGAGVEIKITKRVAVRTDFSLAVGPYFLVAGRAATGVIVHLGGR
jgi:hypothetical protein